MDWFFGEREWPSTTMRRLAALRLLIGKKGQFFLKPLFQVIVETKKERRILWKRQFEILKRTRAIRKKKVLQE